MSYTSCTCIGHRYIKVAKSPMTPAVAFPFTVESSGIILLSDEGIDVPSPEITSIRCQGMNMNCNLYFILFAHKEFMPAMFLLLILTMNLFQEKMSWLNDHLNATTSTVKENQFNLSALCINFRSYVAYHVYLFRE